VEISKRWRLARDRGWQEVEVGKRWRLARGGGWQEVEVAPIDEESTAIKVFF